MPSILQRAYWAAILVFYRSFPPVESFEIIDNVFEESEVSWDGKKAPDVVDGVFKDPTPDEGFVENLNNDWLDIDQEQCRITFDLELEKIILVVLICLCAIEHAFLGYRHFRQTMFLSGALFAMTATYFLVLDKTFGQVAITPVLAMALAGAAGTIFGLVTSMVDYLGLFLTGFYLGAFAAIQAVFTFLFFATRLSLYARYDDNKPTQFKSPDKNTAFSKDAPFSEISLFFVVFGVGAFCAILTLFKPRPLVILSTAQTGAVFFVLSLDWLVEDLRVFTDMMKPTILAGKRVDNVCFYTPYIWLCIWVITLIGILFQFCVSAKDYDHKYGWFNNEIVETLTLRRPRRERRSRPTEASSSGATRSSNAVPRETPNSVPAPTEPRDAQSPSRSGPSRRSRNYRNAISSNHAFREESANRSTDDERNELIPPSNSTGNLENRPPRARTRQNRRSRSRPKSDSDANSRRSAEPAANSGTRRSPEDAYVVRPVVSARPPVASPRINVTATHNRSANLSRRPRRSGEVAPRPVSAEMTGSRPPTYHESMQQDHKA